MDSRPAEDVRASGHPIGPDQLRPIVLTERGDTVTENVLLAAARHPGTTVIRNASPNHMVQDLCFFLEKLGVAIDAHGTTLVHDRVYENRAIYLTELTRLGANVKLMDPHRLPVEGPSAPRSRPSATSEALRPLPVPMAAPACGHPVGGRGAGRYAEGTACGGGGPA